MGAPKGKTQAEEEEGVAARGSSEDEIEASELSFSDAMPGTPIVDRKVREDLDALPQAAQQALLLKFEKLSHNAEQTQKRQVWMIGN